MEIGKLTKEEMEHLEKLAAQGLAEAGILDEQLPDFVAVRTRSDVRHLKRRIWVSVSVLVALWFGWFLMRSDTPVKAKVALSQERAVWNNQVRAQKPIAVSSAPRERLAWSLSMEEKKREVNPPYEEVLPIEVRSAFVWPEAEAPQLHLGTNSLRHFEIRWIEHCKVYVFETQFANQFLPEHTGVWKENATDRDSTLLSKTNVDYNYWMMHAALSSFSAGQYEDAKTKLNELHTHFKNDVNVLFYLAMCEYYIENWAEASVHFRALRALDVCAFGEEAIFYQAMSLLLTKRDEEARLLLKMLVQSESSYAKQSACILEQGLGPCLK
jgi:hypothetical protein